MKPLTPTMKRVLTDALSTPNYALHGVNPRTIQALDDRGLIKAWGNAGTSVLNADGVSMAQSLTGAMPVSLAAVEPVPAPLPADTTAGRAAQLNLAGDYRRFLTGRESTPATALALAHAHATLGKPGAMADLTDELAEFTYDLPFNVYGEPASRNVRATPYNGDIMITDTVNGVTRELCSVARYMTGQLARRAIVVLRERVHKAWTTIHIGTMRESCASHGCLGCPPAMNNPAYLMNATIAPAPVPPLEIPTTVKTQDLRPGMSVRPTAGIWPAPRTVTAVADTGMRGDYHLTFSNGESFSHSKDRLWTVEPVTTPVGWDSTATPEPVPPLEIPTPAPAVSGFTPIILPADAADVYQAALRAGLTVTEPGYVDVRVISIRKPDSHTGRIVITVIAYRSGDLSFHDGTDAGLTKAAALNLIRTLATPEPVPPLEIPTRTITDRDMLDQVRRATDASDGVYDNIAIVDDIRAAYGLVDIDTIDHDAFWAIVARYELGATPPPADHIIPMIKADNRAASYGITHKSEYVYRTSKSGYPTRIVAWDNTGRLNARNGQPVKWGEVGPIDGGHGKYLDPSNRATDTPTSILIDPECIALDAYGTSTGTAGSGQVYAPNGEILRPGETVTLAYPDGTESSPHAVRFTNNGHGYIEI